MQTMTVGEVKSHFSDALDLVQKGEDIVISFGKRKEKVAVLVPFSRYAQKQERTLGLLAGKATYVIKDGFKLTDDELLVS
ncbi:type II toxin-antitoxin system Phd/YefM family antitoxin [bacterium]|jgi:antitoxin (DNA-binding transcriptional repressor) of toxin-antitoxin stability system|nr:type II toxin-antitoxin system Phd/YefM family antitoxin [bacterium]